MYTRGAIYPFDRFSSFFLSNTVQTWISLTSKKEQFVSRANTSLFSELALSLHLKVDIFIIDIKCQIIVLRVVYRRIIINKLSVFCIILRSFWRFERPERAQKKLKNLYARGVFFIQTDFGEVDCIWASIRDTKRYCLQLTKVWLGCWKHTLTLCFNTRIVYAWHFIRTHTHSKLKWGKLLSSVLLNPNESKFNTSISSA